MTQKQIDYFNNLKPFKAVSDIPEIPIFTNDEEYQIVVSNIIRCGAIPKDKMELGAIYIGSCRNSDMAMWDGDDFKYVREKFGHKYIEHINHFEDYTDYDVFVPIKKIE